MILLNFKKFFILFVLIIAIVILLSYPYFKKADVVPVLLYHRLYLEQENPYEKQSDILTVETFKEQMKWLHEEGYNTITLKELQAFIEGEKKLPKKSVMIQFDDGRLSDYRYAYPVLKEYNFHAVTNIITNRANTNEEEWNPEKHQFMNWEQLETIKDVFEWGAHTHNLHNLGEDSKGDLVKESDQAILKDLQTNRELLDGTVSFAYPFGQYTPHTMELVEQAGFKMAFTTQPGDVSPGAEMLELKRREITPDVTMEQFKEIASANSIRTSLNE